LLRGAHVVDELQVIGVELDLVLVELDDPAALLS
jgi:hypothetical protein